MLRNQIALWARRILYLCAHKELWQQLESVGAEGAKYSIQADTICEINADVLYLYVKVSVREYGVLFAGYADFSVEAMISFGVFG